MMGTVALNETVKHALIGTQSPRPAKAADCNLWVNDGPCGGKPGMPSGHSAQVSFLAAYYLQEAFLTSSSTSTSTAFRFFALLLVGYALAVMYSRYVKQCHTPTQILMGALLGTSASVIVLKKAYQWRDK
jgi:membrane-associated phospholipid phosphatase